MIFAERKKRVVFFFFCLLVYLTCIPALLKASEHSVFPIPPFLSDNVLFWKKVYTDVSTDEGLIHDRKYPLIIYQRIKVGDRWGKTLDNYVENYKKRIKNLLRQIPTKPASKRSNEEKRIASLFQEYSSINDIPQAIARIRFQKGLRESFLKGLEQSGMYIDEIFAIIKKQHLPLRLAYLPHVESSFNIKAVSKAGAVGLWQFMATTGKQFLDIDRYIDERRDPILSTEAALQLLKQNYNELHSWPLAITAYNYGLAGIKRAVRTIGSKDISVIIKKHKSKSFQFASKNFYSCFLAACEIDENYKRYFKRVNMASPLLRKRFILQAPTGPIEICKRLNISLSEFRALNPAFKSSLFEQKALIPKYYTIFLPLSMSTENIVDLPVKPPHKKKISEVQVQKSKPIQHFVSIKKPQFQKNEKIRSRNILRYRVKKGDSIWLIAKKFGTDDHTIRQMNGLSRQSYIHPGQIIRVPTKLYRKPTHKRSKRERSVVFQNKTLSVNKNLSSNKSVISRYGTTLWKKYTVKPGDSLWDIAKIMGISADQLKKINHMNNQRLQPGQVLFVPQTTSQQNNFSSNQPDDHQRAIARIRNLENQQLDIDFYYKVKAGDTLKSIATQTDVPLEKIAAINHMTDDLRVYDGQVLRIPKK
jgi:membrane-bound lytic murein transglycosylase D